MTIKKRTKVYSTDTWYGSGLSLSKDTPFTEGQSYTDTRAAKYICNKCDSDKFYVGADDYLTVVLCANCGYEEVVHDG